MTAAPGALWAWVKARLSSWAAGRPAGGPSLSVAARLDLGAKRSLLVVECGGRRFLVGAGAETISAMLELGPPRPSGVAGPRERRGSGRRPARARELRGASAPALEAPRSKR